MRRFPVPWLIPLGAVALSWACAAGAAPPLETRPEQVADSLRPEVPLTRFDHPTDTVAYPLAHADSGVVYYRTVAVVSFEESATGRQVWDMLKTFRAEIIAGTPTGDYVVRFPDSGPEPQRYLTLLDELNRTPGVALAYPTVYSQDIIMHRR